MWRQPAPDTAPFIDECCAFLTGRYADLLAGRGRPRPCWSWLNSLAHGTEVELERLARTLGRHASGGNWAMANAFLAGEVLAAAGADESLAAIQSDVLVPLELDLLSATHRPIWSPADYVSEVLLLLGRHSTSTRDRQRQAER